MGNRSEEMCVCQDMVLVIQLVTVTSVIVRGQEFIASKSGNHKQYAVCYVVVKLQSPSERLQI